MRTILLLLCLCASAIAQPLTLNDPSAWWDSIKPVAAGGGSYTTNTFAEINTLGVAVSPVNPAGMKITVGASSIVVTDLAVYFGTGSYGTPALKIWTASCAEIASVTLSSTTDNAWNWGKLSSAVTLTNGQAYFIGYNGAYQPVFGSTTTITPTSAATVNDSAYDLGTACGLEGAGVNRSTGPMNFKYYIP